MSSNGNQHNCNAKLEKRIVKKSSILTWVLAGVCSLFMACAASSEMQRRPATTQGAFFVVGIGPGDADLLTARALSTIRNADVVFCSADIREKLSCLVDFNKKQVLDGFEGLSHFYGLDCNALAEDRRKENGIPCETYRNKQAELAEIVRKAVAVGKNVAFLSRGDPTLYGTDAWTLQELADLDPSVVPGLSAFNAANAVLQAGLGEVILTTPFRCKNAEKQKDTIENLARYDRATLVIFARRDMDHLLKRLSASFPPDTPVAVVNHAGQQEKVGVFVGAVGDLGRKLPWRDAGLSLVYVGKAVKEAPYRGAVSEKAEGPGKFYLVGTGPGDSDLATLRALEVIRKADLVFASEKLSDRFQKELSGKEVIFGFHRLFPFYGQNCSEVSEAEKKKERMSCEEYHQKQAEFAAQVRKAVAEGKTVVMLDSGDPLIYGPSSWTLKELKDVDTEVVPGLSCFNAANAALAQGIADEKRFHSVVLASGWSVEEMAPLQGTMVLFTMRTEFKKFIDIISAHYPPDTPVAIISSAGYTDREKVSRKRLGDIMKQGAMENQPFEYMIYIGDCLDMGAGS